MAGKALTEKTIRSENARAAAADEAHGLIAHTSGVNRCRHENVTPAWRNGSCEAVIAYSAEN